MIAAEGNDQPVESILLVDDNPTNLNVLYETLDGRGYKLLVSRSVEQALSIVNKILPQLVLLDIMMPGMDGYEVCDRLKSNTATADVPIIFLSALSDTEAKVHGFNLGAVDFITKPFRSEEVIARVATHLKIHRLEQRLARRNRQLQLVRDRILQAMGEGIFGFDADGRAVFANQAAVRMTGWSEQELVGQILDGGDAEHSPGPLPGTDLRSALADGRMRTVEDDRFRRKDGSTFPVEYSIAPTVVDGQVDGAVLVFKDITERTRAQRELKQAHAALLQSHSQLQEAQDRLIQAAKLESVGRLAAGVAHEVKNPLAVIQLGADYLSQVLSEDATSQSVLDDISDAVTRADNVVKGLLDFSREHRLELKPIDLNEILRDSLQLVQHELTQHDIRLQLDLDPDIPALDLDPHRMQQVFINLFVNAVHAMERAGVLSVATRFEVLDERGLGSLGKAEGFADGDKVVRVSVADTGCGFDADGEQKLFDPFFTTKPVGEGTGLGLSVTRNIIKLHAGSIRIRNRDQGGAEVTILFREK